MTCIKASASFTEAFSVFCGADAVKAFECFTEKMRIVISAHNSYLLYGKVGGDEQLLCRGHAQGKDVFSRRHTHLLLEKIVEARDAEMLNGGKLGNANFGTVIRSNVTERICQCTAFFSVFNKTSRRCYQKTLKKRRKLSLAQSILLWKRVKDSSEPM